MATKGNKGSADRAGANRLEVLEPRVLMDASQALQLFSTSPALFIENQGQWADGGVRYVHNGDGVNVAMTEAGIAFQSVTETAPVAFSASFVGANSVSPVGLDKAESVFNYYLGDPSTWHANVPSYQTVAYENLYQGIDLLTWGRRDSLKYEFHVAPGADWSQIAVHYDGIAGLTLDDSGALHVKTAAGDMVDDAPYIYQVVEGRQVQVAGRFTLEDPSTYSFRITGGYEAAAPLIIDPNLAWSTYLGGGNEDLGYAVASDALGDVLVTGLTKSSGWVSGGWDTDYSGGTNGDAFVVKLSPSGVHLWSTYLGGSQDDWGNGIATDAGGNVLVAGNTWSPNWVSGGSNTNYNPELNDGDGFIVKLTPAGGHLWSTYLGGRGRETGDGIAVDASGNVMVVGETHSAGWISGGWITDLGLNVGGGYVAKFAPAGEPLWSSYLGGPADSGEAQAVAVDASGNVLVTGTTSNSGWLSGGWVTSINGYYDAYAVKLAPSGEHLWSSYLGGSSDDVAGDIAVDASGNVFVTGTTRSDVSWVSGGWRTSYCGGNYDAFLVKLSPFGQHIWSTYLGGVGYDYGFGIAADPSGNVMVTGKTYNSAWISGGWDGDNGGTFVVRLAPSGGLVWGTTLGGSGDSCGYGMAVDPSGNVLLTGATNRSGWTSGGWDTTYNDDGTYWDAFAVKISLRVVGVSAGAFPEDQPAGTLVGILSTADPDAPDAACSYSLASGVGDTDNASFSIVGNQLVTNAAFDYELGQRSFKIRIRSTRQDGVWCENQLSLSLVDVNLAPTDIGLTAATVGGQAAGTVVGPLSAVDPEAPATSFTYALVSGTGDTDNACFTIAGGQLKTTALQLTNPKGMYNIRIRVTDAGGMWFEKAFALAAYLPGDANKDGTVNLEDFGILKMYFGMTGGRWDFGDFNGDKAMDLQDFGLLKDHFGLNSPLTAVGESAAGESAVIPAVPTGDNDGQNDDTAAGIDPAALVLVPELTVAGW